MEIRKLMAFGQSSYIVSVPKAWVTKNRLKKGDTLVVEEKPHELTLFAHGTEERRKLHEISIETRNKSDQHIKTEITSAYVNNYDLITVLGENKSLKLAKTVFRGLAGMEVLEETATKIVGKELLDIKEVPMQSLVRRIDNIIRCMLTDLLVLQDNLKESLYDRDAEVNRLTLLAFRTSRAAMENPRVLRLFGTTYLNIVITKDVVFRLERFGDQIKRLAKVVESGTLKEPKRLKEFKRVYGAVSNQYEKVMKVYYTNKKDEAYSMEGESKALLKQCDAFMEHHKSVSSARTMEYVKHMIVALNGIIRSTMESE